MKLQGRSAIARSGLDWLSFMVACSSLLIFSVVFMRVFAGKGIWVGVVIVPVVALGLVLLCARSILKQVVLFKECLAISRSIPTSEVLIPYECVEQAEYYPHVFRSGPALVLRYRTDRASQRVRVSLRGDSEFFVAKLEEAGVRIKVR
jgi:hypothetical protein